LHVSDTHLGKRQYNLDFREEDIYQTFREIIDIAIKERVKAILHTGDFYDVYNPSNKAEFFAITELRRLKEKGIQIIAIPGDHDSPKRSSEIYPLYLLKELELLKLILDPLKDYYKIIAEGEEICVHGSKHHPYISSEKLKESLKQLKPLCKKSTLLLHQGYKELLPYQYSWQIQLADLPKGFKYYALGHIHDRVVIKKDDGSIIAVAGSPDILREDEIEGYKKNGKGVYLLDFSKDEVILQKIDLEIRRQEVERILVNELNKEVERIINKYKDAGKKKKPILHLILEGEVLKREIVEKELRRLFQVVEYYRIYKDNTKVKIGSHKLSIPEKSTIDDMIIQYLKINGLSQNEAELVLRIINSEDEDEISKLLMKYGGLE